MSYIKGQLVRLTGTFTVNNANTDPTVVKFYILEPDRTTATTYTYVTDPEVIKDATGIYHMDYAVWNEGTYYYRVEGTGAVRAANESSFYVEKSKFV